MDSWRESIWLRRGRRARVKGWWRCIASMGAREGALFASDYLSLRSKNCSKCFDCFSFGRVERSENAGFLHVCNLSVLRDRDSGLVILVVVR